MATAFSGFTGQLIQWIVTPFFWLIALMLVLIITIGLLAFRKKKRLVFPTVEVVDLGDGKVAFNTGLKSGYFGIKSYMKNLWWRGEEVLKLSNGQQIYDFTTNDFHEVNGKRGVIVYRDPVNQKILVPFSRFHFKNTEFLGEIADATYIDIGVKIFDDTIKETTPFKNQILQFLGWALIILFSFIVIIFITNWISSTQQKASDLLLQAGDKGIKNCKDMCIGIVQTLKP